MSYLDNAKLADKTKSYHRNGWRLLEQTRIAGMRLNHITAEDVDALPLPGGPYNINCAPKTLRRMLHKAEEWGLIAKVPKLKLSKELGRTLRLDQEAERKLLAAADSPGRCCSRTGYRDAQQEGTLPCAHRGHRLEQSCVLYTRQQD
jgi:hypothetical protein